MIPASKAYQTNLAVRILIAAFMKQTQSTVKMYVWSTKNDYSCVNLHLRLLTLLLSVWKTNDAGHAHCSQCMLAMMMWVRWQCKICKSYFCFEYYSAKICGISEHGTGKYSHQASLGTVS